MLLFIIEATKEDVVDFYEDIMEPCLASGTSILAFDGNELLSIALNKIVDISADNKQIFDYNLPPFNQLKKDYAEGIFWFQH